MNFFKNITKPFKFGYDAILNKGRRREPTNYKKAEINILPQTKRNKLYATVYDLVRNSTEANWAYNKYLDYTTTFYFQSKTKNAEFDRAFEEAFSDWSKKENCDIAGRHDLQMMIRLHGAGIGLGGDSLINMIDDEYKLQGIEGDRITKPSDYEKINSEWAKNPGLEDGLLIDEYGMVISYILCNRGNNSKNYTYSALLDPENVIFTGNFFRFDQMRGISPFAHALNIFQDLKEIDEYQLMKCKKHAMFGLMLKSDQTGDSGFNEEASTSNDESGNTITEYFNQLQAGIKIEGGKDDGVEMFESKNPSTEYQQYSELMLRKALLIFGIPFTFFDSRQSSYSAMKQDRAEFNNKVLPFRNLIESDMYRISEWVKGHIIEKYDLSLPNGFSVETLPYEWIPKAEPWIDEKAEIEAALLRIGGGLSSRTKEGKRRGTDIFDSFRDLASEERYIEEANLHIGIGLPGQPITNTESLPMGEVENNNEDPANEVNNEQ